MSAIAKLLFIAILSTIIAQCSTRDQNIGKLLVTPMINFTVSFFRQIRQRVQQLV